MNRRHWDFRAAHNERLNSGTLALIGRVLLAAIFIISGISKIPGWASTLQMMTAKGVPFAPFFLVLATALEIGAGLAVLLGWKAKAASTLLFLYLIPVTLIFHNFWSMDGMDRVIQTIMFLKNLSIMGGLLNVAAHGPGIFSMDAGAYRRNSLEPG